MVLELSLTELRFSILVGTSRFKISENSLSKSLLLLEEFIRCSLLLLNDEVVWSNVCSVDIWTAIFQFSSDWPPTPRCRCSWPDQGSGTTDWYTTGSCCSCCNIYTENKKLVRAFAAALLLSTIQSQKCWLEQTILSILLELSESVHCWKMKSSYKKNIIYQQGCCNIVLSLLWFVTRFVWIVSGRMNFD